MGRELIENFTAAKKVFDTAREVLGYSIEEICTRGPEETLTRTVYAQPAIFVTSIAALRVLAQKFPGLKPALAAGLSLGEFTALVAAGSIRFEDGLVLVKKRAEAMEQSAINNPGTMASVIGLTQNECVAIAKHTGCEIANLNSPDQIVLSGNLEAITAACRLAEEGGAKRAIPLKVGGAFHSSLMKDAQTQLQSALSTTKIAPPECVFIPNASSVPATQPDEIRNLLALQLVSPVRWTETMLRASNRDIQFAIEIGPGKVLRGLARKCNCSFTVEPCELKGDFEKLEHGILKPL